MNDCEKPCIFLFINVTFILKKKPTTVNSISVLRYDFLWRKSETYFIAHVNWKPGDRYCLPNYISVLTLYMLNSCYLEIYTCILSVIHSSFTIPLLLHDCVNRITHTRPKNSPKENTHGPTSLLNLIRRINMLTSLWICFPLFVPVYRTNMLYQKNVSFPSWNFTNYEGVATNFCMID